MPMFLCLSSEQKKITFNINTAGYGLQFSGVVLDIAFNLVD